MNGLFPKEEIAVERWTVLCKLATEICEKKNKPVSTYYPNQHSKDSKEKTIGIALSNYRQGMIKKGTTCIYECVEYIIKSFGFEHWLLFYTDEEKTFKKWENRIINAHKRSLELELPIHLYYPCQRSNSEIEKETSVALNNYIQAQHNKGTHKVYEYVTELINTKMPHWLTMKKPVKIILEKWRKRWELIKYICQQKKCPYNKFYQLHLNGHVIEQRIIDAIHSYQSQTPRYKEIDELISLAFDNFI